MSLKHRPRRDREGPRMAMADPGSPKRPKSEPPMPKAKPLVDDGKPTRRRAIVERLLDEIVMMKSYQVGSDDCPVAFGTLYKEYGKDLLQILVERMEQTEARTDKSIAYAYVALDMAIYLGGESRRSQHYLPSESIGLSLKDMDVVVPALIEKLDALVQTHEPGRKFDDDLETVIMALDWTKDARGQEKIAELARDNALVRDSEHLEWWLEKHGKR